MSAGASAVTLAGRPAAAVADPEGLRLAQQVSRKILLAETIAGGLGAADVFVLLWWVLPNPDVAAAEDTTVLLVNAAALAIYLVLGFAVGTSFGRRAAGPVVTWLSEDRPPTDRERRAALRQPLLCATIDAIGWVVAALFFFALNCIWSVQLAAHVASTILLGGLTVVSVVYLLVERINRPITARALAGAPPRRRIRAGVKSRLVLVFLSATGVPLFGLVLVGVHALVFGGVSADKLAVTAVVMASVAGAFGLVATLLVAKSVADPLRAVRRALGLIEEGVLDARVEVFDASEIGEVQSGVNRMVAGLQERERLRDLFGRHVGEDVARAALDTDRVELGGEVREVAALFVDLVGSTALAQRRPPREVVQILNDFFAIVVEVVGREGGWVNKFEGDAALCVWGAPAGHDDCAAGALAAARTLHDRLSRKGIDAGIGVSAGPAVAGNVGAEHRFEYTIIGDAVNEAARLCDLAKRRDERVVASDAILRRCRNGEASAWSHADSVVLRGRSSETRLAVPARG